MKIINLNDHLTNLIEKDDDKFNSEHFFQNCMIKYIQNNLAAVFKNNDNDINILVINKNGQICHFKKDLLCQKRIISIDRLSIVCSADRIFIYVEFKKKKRQRSSCNDNYLLMCFDEKLSLVATKYLDKCIEFCLMASFESQLFTITTLSIITIITSYDSNLMITGYFGQNEIAKQFYLPMKNCTQFEINEKYFIFSELETGTSYINVVIMDRITGFSKKTNIRFWYERICVFANDHILTYDDFLKLLSFYDLNGKLVDTFKIGILPKRTQLMDSNNTSGLLFFSPEKLVILF